MKIVGTLLILSSLLLSSVLFADDPVITLKDFVGGWQGKIGSYSIKLTYGADGSLVMDVNGDAMAGKCDELVRTTSRDVFPESFALLCKSGENESVTAVQFVSLDEVKVRTIGGDTLSLKRQ